jgi:hypothetical protein
VSASGASRMRQATDGSVVAEIDIESGLPLAPVTKWLRSDQEGEIGVVQGWPLTSQPWPAPYLAEGSEEFTYRVVVPSDPRAIELIPPPGIWSMKATLATPGPGGPIVVLERAEPGTWSAGADRQTRIWIAKLDPGSWQVTGSTEVLVDGRTVARHLGTSVGRGIALSGDGSMLYVGVEKFDGNTVKVMAISTGSMEKAWERDVAVTGEPAANRVSLELATGTERDRLVVLAGSNKQNGIATSALVVFDREGNVLLDHAFTLLEQLDRTTGLLVVGENEVVAQCAIVADDDERGTLRLRSFSLKTGESAVRWDLPASLVAADFHTSVSLWDGKRGKFLVAPVSYESARRAGFLHGLPATVPPPASARGRQLGDVGAAHVKTPDFWYKPGRPRFDAWKAQSR